MKAFYFFISFSIFFCLENTIYAANYTFIGSGDMNIAANWEGGLIPPYFIGKSDTVFINGNAVNGIRVNCPQVCNNGNCYIDCPLTISDNNGVIIVGVGDTLTLQNWTQFSNGGSLIINGTLINKTTLEAFNIGTITVNGTFLNKYFIGNQGLFTINNGALVINDSGNFTNNFVHPGVMILNGGTITNYPPGIIDLSFLTNNGGIINNHSILKGNAQITGDLPNAGTLSPGNSPGSYMVTGNYTATSSTIHNFEVAGNTSGNYDLLSASGSLNLDGALNVSLLDGYIPTPGQDVTIMTGTVNGRFSQVSLPPGYSISYNSNSVVLSAPLPLPVHMVHFSGKKENNKIILDWKVQNEMNVASYEIQKSNDGILFHKAGYVNAEKKSEYSYVENASSNISYYRIKSIDRNGSYSYSIIISIRTGDSEVLLRAFPSPALNQLTIQHSTAIEKAAIMIFSIDGKLLIESMPSIGSQQTTINISQLQRGTYIVKYQNQTNPIQFLKIIKE